MRARGVAALAAAALALALALAACPRAERGVAQPAPVELDWPDAAIPRPGPVDAGGGARL